MEELRERALPAEREGLLVSIGVIPVPVEEDSSCVIATMFRAGKSTGLRLDSVPSLVFLKQL